MNNRLIITLFLSVVLTLGVLPSASAQQEQVYQLPNVEVDTLAYPALRILKQLQQHEKEDRFATIKSFDIQTEGDYSFEFKASKFLKRSSRVMMSLLGYPRISKIFIGNDLVSHKIHAKQHFSKGKLEDVDVRLDSANIELSQKQYDLIRRSNLEINDKILAQFRSPKQPWGSKKYDDYEWLLVDTLTMNGHRVDVLQFQSRPSKGLVSKLQGQTVGKIWVIEDYWRVIGVERQNLKNRTAMNARLEEVAPGVFLPSEMTVIEDFQLDPRAILESKNINPDSLSEKDREKLEKKIRKADASICDGYRLRMRYNNVETKE